MTKKPYPSQTQDRFIVRLPDGLRDRIAAAAKANNRSMNSELVATLEAAYPVPEAEGILISELEAIFARARETKSKPDAEELYEAIKSYAKTVGIHPDIDRLIRKIDMKKLI